PQSEVVLGRSGRLFLCCRRTLDDFRRVKTLDDRMLDAWQAMLENRAKWLARRDIQYVVLACPNGQTIYPEHMPRSIKQLDRPSTFDQLIARLRAGGIVTVVDPRDELRAAKANREVYYRTDSHWNDYGAYLGYRLLMQQIARRYPAAAPTDLDRFTIDESDGPSFGNLAKMVDSPLLLRDHHVRLIPRWQSRARQKIVRRPQPGEDNQYFIHVATNPDATLGAAVVMCDSFFANVMPLFNEHFQTVHYYAMGRHDKPLPTREIERLHPEVVVHEFVERALILYDALDEQSELIEPESVPYLAAPIGNTLLR
ncbi:MAG TPA: hypothetical protein VG713_20315, partial [Pirellulales bacterium]|nr:hypothetical protein [Pirellulales bacterium]